MMISFTVGMIGTFSPASFMSPASRVWPDAPSTATFRTSACFKKLMIHAVPARAGLQSMASTNTWSSVVFAAMLMLTFWPSLPYFMPTYKRPLSAGSFGAFSCIHSASLIADFRFCFVQNPRRWMLKSRSSSPISSRIALSFRW